MNVGSLFSGIGLLDYGLCLAGLEHAWFCESDPFRRQILARRWPGVRIFDDVRAVGAATAERVDVIAGGFPCKGASTAGKREGFGHPETRLWREMARAVRELEPRFVVVENVANLLAVHDGAVWGEVLGDLAALGYDVQWDCFPAAAFGAPHLRDRVIAVATDTTESRGPGRPAGSGISREGRRDHALPGAEAAPDPGGNGVRVESVTERRSSGQAVAPGAGGAPADAASAGGQGARSERSALGGVTAGRGVAVDWGGYAPAIARWEAIHGSAPEPLVRRVDDRRARGVERSRLSALGDGVQVQLGEMVGRYLMGLS